MRRNTRQHQAADIKEINQSSFKKDKDKTWVQCHICKDWLWEETYFKTDWYTTPTEYYPTSFGLGYAGGSPTYRICNACCHTALDVVDYLEKLTADNTASYVASLKAWKKAEKKKEKEALCIVDGKNYTFTFKETKDK